MNPFRHRHESCQPLKTAGLLITLLLLHSPVFGDIYKWTDDSGEVQYTQMPPPSGTDAQKIEGAPPPADSPQAVHREQQKLQEQLDAMEERRTRQDEDAAIRKEHAENSEINRKNCITARNNLAKLQQGGIKRYLTPEGEVVRLTDDERQRRITEANRQVKQYCSS